MGIILSNPVSNLKNSIKGNSSFLLFNLSILFMTINNLSLWNLSLLNSSSSSWAHLVASITKKQVEEIAKKKMQDLNAFDLEEASKIIAGSARSMGIEVKE